MPASLRYEVVDVFTDTPFAGNPLAVVLDAEGLTSAAMQALAREFHLSETAFPLRTDEDGVDYVLRIFTPEVELPFAGHPSVGTAWLMARLGRVRPGTVHQRCSAGRMRLHVTADAGPVELVTGPATAGDLVDPGPLLAAVGLVPDDAAQPGPRLASTGLPTMYLRVGPDAVGRARPDLAALGRLSAAGGWENLSVFAWDEATRAAHARVFCASLGIPEDPATGSAATGFGGWLAASGCVPVEGETDYVIAQGAELHRPSTLEGTVVTRGGQALECRVRGRVVAVARGEILVPAG